MFRLHTIKCSLRKQASVEAAQSGVRAGGGELIKALTKYGFGGNLFDAECVGEKLIAPVEIDIIKIVPAVTEQSNLGEKDVPITDCIASSGVKIFRKSPLCVVFEKQSAEMIASC